MSPAGGCASRDDRTRLAVVLAYFAHSPAAFAKPLSTLIWQSWRALVARGPTGGRAQVSWSEFRGR